MSSSGRRSWSGEQKRRIIEATLVPGASVAEVARQYEVNANLLFKWLRQAGRGRGVAKRTGREGDDASVVPMEFVPLGVFGGSEGTAAAASLPLAAPSERSASSGLASAAACSEERPGVIEIDLPDGTRIRVDAFVNERALRRVLAVLKEPAVIQLAPGTKVYLACRPVDMRYGFDGLAAQVAQMLGSRSVFAAICSSSARQAPTT